MRVIVEIGHPAHVHLFRHLVQELRIRGHEVEVMARDKDVTLQLLKDFGIEHACISRKRQGAAGLLVEMLVRDWRLLRLARDFQPDVLLGVSCVCSAQVSALLGKVSIILDDTEHSKFERAAYLPFATVVCTPDAYRLDLGRKQVRYAGYQELAYLHPDRFTPNHRALQEIGLREEDHFFIVRFVSWGAGHDVGERGFSDASKRRLISELGQHGRVIITSESPLPPEFEPFRLSISPTKIHDLLYYSSLYIGEGGTMASEAAILGVPSIYVNSLKLGYLEEQEKEYGLVHRVTDEQRAIALAVELAASKTTRAEYKRRRQRLLSDKIDVTTWMVDFVEQYDPRGDQ